MSESYRWRHGREIAEAPAWFFDALKNGLLRIVNGGERDMHIELTTGAGAVRADEGDVFLRIDRYGVVVVRGSHDT